MAKKAYGGVNNIARNGIKIYAGVNNVARNVVKGYAGVDGVARQFWPVNDNIREGLKYSVPYVSGGTYEFDYCYPILAITYAIKEALKINKGYYKVKGIYDLIRNTMPSIISYFLSHKGDANIVRVYIENSSYDGGNTFIVICWDKVTNLNRQISQVTTDSQYGNEYATLTDSIYLTQGVTFAISHSTHNVRTWTGGGYLNYIGLYLSWPSGSYGAALSVTTTNLGMTNYSIETIYDWYWDFSSGDSPMIDKVDGLSAFESNTTRAFDGLEIDKQNSRIQLPSFIFQTSRTIEIFFGEFDRHYTEYTSPSYYKYYEPCELVSLYSSSASQYSTHKAAGISFQGWNDNEPAENPYPKSNGVDYWGAVGSVYENYMGVNGLKDKSIQIKLPETGGWQAQWYQFMYADSGNDNFWITTHSLDFRIGWSGASSYKAAYKFKVKRVAVY